MSDVEIKYFYRNVYLTSEHWQSLRVEKLAKENARCKICGLRDLSNDVHHVVYRNLYGCTTDDLVVLCRKCHEEVHGAIKKNPKINRARGSRNRWKRTIVSIRSYSRIEFGRRRAAEVKEVKVKCVELRTKLVAHGYIFNGKKCVPLTRPFLNRIYDKVTDSVPDFWYLVCRYKGLKIQWPCGEH